MFVVYIFLNYDCILLCEMYFSDRWGHSHLRVGKNLLCYDLIKAKLTTFHKLILIVYNDARAIFLKFLWG